MANANNLKFLVCCANGSGSSLMAQLALDKVLKRNGIKCKTHHAPLSEGKSTAAQYDVLLCAQNFASMFTDAEAKGVKVIPLKNVMSDKEIDEEHERAVDEIIDNDFLNIYKKVQRNAKEATATA